MELAHLTTILPGIAAEPASIIYMVSGAIGLLFVRPTVSQRATDSSTAMLFCRKQTHDKLNKLKLI